MDTILAIFGFVFGILSLVLFFKVWGMCNNVERIEKRITPKGNVAAQFYFMLSIGEKEKAKEILFNQILSDQDIFYDHSNFTYRQILAEIKETYGDALQKLDIKLPEIKEE